MTPGEILGELDDLVNHYPDDRLRLTGEELVALIEFVKRVEREACAKAAEIAPRIQWNPNETSADVHFSIATAIRARTA